ncbi:uncharacterized protein LOC105159570 isoform X2 [Sesamum indicum]|uniref:Uncharacterized protein LOC105159570 isoform X2 n=1 Tax=Sesamum indicum TaxID=4182 RepID=A0A6I9SZC3_SESIN|nr:uncharacterized protein LOC105159570 isoform X2 [Sesamum indicum]
MEVVEATNDFQDWDVVQSNSGSESASVNSFDEIDSGGLIQTNYFSLDAHNQYGQDLDDKKSSAPSWVDPRLEEKPARYLNLESGEFWSDSSTQRSDDRKFSDEVAFSLNEKKKVGFQGIREVDEEKCATMVELGRSYSDSNGIEVGSAKLNDSVENPEVGVGGHVNLHDELEILGKEKNENEKIGCGSEVIHENVEKRRGEPEKRGSAWWKMPMEFLRYCVFRVSPVWTGSVVAAALGFVILGRRLYKMKNGTKGLQIKVTVDDKVSQVISHAARLNEAFSVVKRVPVVRPSLPSVGIITWPVMSLK